MRLGDDLVVLRLYAAVRDHNWNTIEPRFTRHEVEDHGDHFTVRYTAEHVSPDVDFAWDGVITGSADGVIRVEMDGQARRDFMKNRIGWCVLHPMGLAGTPASTLTPDGVVNGPVPGPDFAAPALLRHDIHLPQHAFRRRRDHFLHGRSLRDGGSAQLD